MRKAVFLDRDGVINKERRDYVKTVDELELLSDLAEPVKRLKDAGFLIVVVTNQSAVNRGLVTHDGVKDIHSVIQEHFRRNGTSVDAFYYCPHRPDEHCECRKPKPGLILKAAHELGIDLASSWMIGDNDSDVQAAHAASCKAIKLDAVMSLFAAVQMILSHS